MRTSFLTTIRRRGDNVRREVEWLRVQHGCTGSTHLGLLLWELKYVAISLTYPGLKPARQ
jgi:hypothetical protein